MCKLKFANSKDLSNHMKKEYQKEQKFKKKRIPTTLKKLKFSCTKCEAKFSEKTDYIEHGKSHDGKKKSGKPSGSTSQVSCSTFFYDFASLFKLIFILSKIDQIIICLKKKYNSTVEKKIKILKF